MNLKKEFISLVKNLKLSSDEQYINGLWKEIELYYLDRAYHNLEHVQDVLTSFNKLLNFAKESVNEAYVYSAQLAIIFHDIIYNPGNKWNEWNSYDYAVEKLDKLLYDNTFKDCIIITRHLDDHDKFYSRAIANYVADADLAGLADSNTFESNGMKIRAEYDCTDGEFVKGRIAFFTALLQRKYIFRTNIGREMFELPARANMADYIRKNT